MLTPLFGRNFRSSFSNGLLAKTPRSRIVGLSTLTTSRVFRPLPIPDSTDAISIVDGEYSLYSDGAWGAFTSDAGTWGNAVKVKIRLTSYNIYGVPLDAVLTIGGVEYTFTITTIGEAPALDLNFAKAKSLDPRITFSRASEATYFGADGLLKTAAVDGPCFDHDPITGESKGLAIWEARTNQFTYSKDFDNAAWGKIRSSVVPNAALAPDGTVTMAKLVEDTTAFSTHQINATAFTPTANTSYTFSVFAGAGERPLIELILGPSFNGVNQLVAFNLITGAASIALGSPTFKIEMVSDSIYRCSITATSSASPASTIPVIRLNNGITSTYTGDGVSGAYIWGAQLEVGAFPSPYIPTVASAVTRAADIAQMTGSNFSDWYRQDEGSFVCKFDTNTSGIGYPIIFRADNGTTQNAISFVFNATVSVYFYCVNGGTPQASLGNNIFLVSPGVSNITSGAYKLNDFGASYNGSVSLSDNLGTPPMVSNFTIGHKYDSSVSINGHIAHLAYYPLRLSNTELQALSQQ
jgi:hypothetical protein